MKTIGNILWLLICGLVLALLWFLFGLLWCVTILGIPIGIQCFKCARLMLWPVGYTVAYGPGVFSFIVNILWILLGGFEIALFALILGAVLCVTIIGIPFGLQCFKFAKLAFMPFGAKIVPKSACR